VFLDQNGNGDRDPGESWVNGTLVTLQDASRQTVRTRQSTGFGQFAFSGLPNGTYTLVAAAPAGLVNTNAVAGTGGQGVDARTIQVTTSGGTISYDGQLFLVRDENGGTTPVPPVNPPPVQSNPSVSLAVDKTVAAPGDTLTYTLNVAAGQAGLSR